MVNISSITYKQKVLLYLKRYQNRKERTERSEDVTQKGIVENVGLSRSHSSRVVKELIDEGFIEVEKTSVEGHEKKLKTYYLTQKGLKKVQSIFSDLSEIEVTLVEEGGEKKVPLSDLEDENHDNINLLNAISVLESSEDRTINLDEHQPFKAVKRNENAPEIEELYGRDEELNKMEDWIKGNTPILALLGHKGYGASSLAAKFVEGLEGRHVLWIDLKEISGNETEKEISSFLEEIGEEIEDPFPKLFHQEALLVFDDYYEVDEELVSFLNQILNKIDRSCPLKIMITGRKGTPVYERFYQPKDVENGLVREVELSSLNEDDAQKILGKKIKNKALERIMMFTKGSPLMLRLLKEGKEERLCELTPWEKEQISLLMYLKTETRD